MSPKTSDDAERNKGTKQTQPIAPDAARDKASEIKKAATENRGSSDSSQ